MLISILNEISSNETRVAATPESIKLLIRFGASVIVEKEAGKQSGYLDEEYLSVGAKISKRSECLKQGDICLTVRMPSVKDICHLKTSCILIGMLNPYQNKNLFDELNKQKITSCCLELLPRISRAQNMDVLSSQSNLAGYRSVIDAAEQFSKVFPMMMTAAGRINPAKVIVLGVGVAGLQAIATARRLGAVVCATDVRLATKEQVESLGAKFIMVEDEEARQAETAGGYAKEMSEAYKRKQFQLLATTISKQDIVICTALIPGKPAPVLVTPEMVQTMAPGSVIVDLAVEAGGNCSLSKVGKIISYKGVKIVGYDNVPGKVAKDASSLYAKNIVNFLSLIIGNKDQKITIDWEDEIIKAVVLTHNGNLKLEQFK